MKKERVKKEIVRMELVTFDIPPAGDVLVLVKRAPIGPQAAKKCWIPLHQVNLNLSNRRTI